MAKVITITSGKGGVGKTSISLNLSLSLASSGYRVCLFDADLGLANVNILTGIFPEHGLEQVIKGELGLKDIMIKNFQGVDIIPGSSGVEKMVDLTEEESDALIKSFLDLGVYDYFIFDTSAGISSQVLSFCLASHEMILVVTPEPTSLTDAYSLLKVLARNKGLPVIRVVVNQVKTADSAKTSYNRLRQTVQKFLSIKILPLGIVAYDRNVPAAIMSQVPFYKLFPGTMASRCIQSIVRKLVNAPGKRADIPLELFWYQCFEFFNRQKKIRRNRSQSPRTAADTKKIDLKPSVKENDPGVIELKESLTRIESRMAMLMSEMGRIRQLLARSVNQKADEQEDSSVKETLPASKLEAVPVIPLPRPGKIYLDFEAWIAKKKL